LSPLQAIESQAISLPNRHFLHEKYDNPLHERTPTTVLVFALLALLGYGCARNRARRRASVGWPAPPRDLVEWRPFSGGLSARSTAYALTVLSALFRWLIEQRYVLANPFAGVKVRGHATRPALDTTRGLTEGDWMLVPAIAEGLEWSYGWSEPAAHRLRFLLDFGYAKGLRASELAGAMLGNDRVDGHGDHWLHLVGKGNKPGKVALLPLATTALDQYLAERQLTVTPVRRKEVAPFVRTGNPDF